ncbi:biotin--[acetyl-CoA-carboxylase] ligase [Treponema sp. OMZ 840]|uniref:biotin--[acetyl-CoA-carboxylase] ligase n=1 Tax=Treponema sp. OMZ 840 TaxID=244313 RepID=UPI003D8A6D71
MADVLSAQKIETLLSESASACRGKIEVFQTIDSTSTEAKRRLQGCDSENSDIKNLHGQVLFAERQTAGRGRLGRSFFSPAQSGIYVSIIYMPEFYLKSEPADILGRQGSPLENLSLITSFAAVAVCRTLESFDIEAKIKWVNDIFVNEKKVCGILTEGVFSSGQECKALIIGIGINVYESEAGFPEELKHIAGAISIDGKKEIQSLDRNVLAARLISNVFEICSGKRCSSEVMNEYRQRSFIIGKKVFVMSAQETYEAEVLEITDNAHLIVKNSSGEQRELLSGEISLRL